MFKLYDYECPTCGARYELLVEGDEAPDCLMCLERVGIGIRLVRLPFVGGSAQRAQVNPAKTRERFSKSAEMRNKITGKTPWRRSSHSQTDNS